MLEDRSYMREDPHRSRWSATVILIIAVVVCFALQNIAHVYWQGTGWIHERLVLSVAGLKHLYVWQLLTFQFLHGGFSHLFWNCVGLLLFGRTVERRLGTQQFLRVYFLSGIAGGLLQVVLQWLLPAYFGGGGVMGASAGVLGIVAAFAIMEPEAPVLFSFILPIKAKHLLWLELGVALFFTLVPAPSSTANAAHLGGILAAIVYMRWDVPRPSLNWNPWQGRKRKRQLVQAAAQISRWRGNRDHAATELPPEEFISKEVDPILDKISAHGIHSLTPRERQILEAARAKMAKR